MGLRKIIKWDYAPIDAYRPASAQGLEYLPRIYELLEWGPQHVDLVTQHLMRCCYHRTSLTEAPSFDDYCEALASGDEVCFWCEPVLGSCLSIAWVLETLGARGATLDNSFLVLSPGRSNLERLDPEKVQQAFEERVPTLEVFAALVAARRHLASDSPALDLDLSPFPTPVRDWVSVARRLADFLPDRHGLDIIDRLLLDRLVAERVSGDEWPNAATILGRARNYPDGHFFGTGQMWERLLQLSGFSLLYPLSLTDTSASLVAARFEGLANMAGSRFAITPFGQEVIAGNADALPTCTFVRWVGGREVSRHRQLRR
jgi:hypothetical protein